MSSYHGVQPDVAGDEEPGTPSGSNWRDLLVCLGISALMAATMLLYGSLKPPGIDCSQIASGSSEHSACVPYQKAFFEQVLEGLPMEMNATLIQFEKFLAQNQRDYRDKFDVDEYKKRLVIFNATLWLVDQRNADETLLNPSPDRALHGINKYADWDPDEFEMLLGGKLNSSSSSGQSDASGRRLRLGRIFGRIAGRESIRIAARDRMREHERNARDGPPSAPAGPVPCTKTWYFSMKHGSVRNQGQCGDCWAYSVTETIRTAYIQQQGKDPGPLSTQFLVDCMTHTTCQGGVNGCCGGSTVQAMHWITQQGGIPSTQAYGDYYEHPPGDGLFAKRAPGGGLFADLRHRHRRFLRRLFGPVSHSGEGLSYSGNHPEKSFPCKENIARTVALTTSSQLHGEAGMGHHICNSGWISISVDATTWQTYTGGVLSAASCGTKVNHAVVAIGLDASKNAWIVQNSWGDDWGVAIDESRGSRGYVLLEYGQNTCAIASEPVVANSVSAATAN